MEYKNKNIRKRVFIVGCPRSGTTLVQSIILSHKDVVSFPESHFFSNSFLSEKSKKYPNLYTCYFYLKWILKIRKNNIKIKYRIGLRRSTTVKKFIKSLDDYTIKNNKMIWVEKTPSHLKVIDIISEYIPDAVFIHVIRDGCDVVASLYDVTQKFPKEWNRKYTIDEAIERYNTDIGITKLYKGRKNHFVVNYDRLIKDNDYKNNIFDFLGLKDTSVNNSSNVYRMIVTKEELWKHQNKKSEIIDTRMKKFKTLFSDKEQRRIKQLIKSIDI